MSSPFDAFPHVDPEVIKLFFQVISDKYLVVDKANYILEESGFDGLSIAIVNQRDFLSHLCTVLTDTSLDKNGQMAQYSAGEEHLRRAIIESYQMAVDMKMLSFSESYEKYKLSAVVRSLPSQTSTIHKEIMAKLEEIKILREKGRSAKSINKWNESWEKGVESLYEAYKKVGELQCFLDDSFEVEKFKIANEKLNLIRKWKLIAGVSIALTATLVVIMLFSRLF